jgi:hypothetical protein
MGDALEHTDAVTSERALEPRAIAAPVSQVVVSCQDKTITFETGAASLEYPLQVCRGPSATHAVSVTTDGVIDLKLPAGTRIEGSGDFSAAAAALAGQTRVSVVVQGEPAPAIVEEPPAPDQPPVEATLLTPDQAAGLARAGELLEVAPGQRLDVKTFPLLLPIDWMESRRAPILARADGDDVLVHQPYRVSQDPSFAGDVATLPRSVFTDSLRVHGDELVQVRYYDPATGRSRIWLMAGRRLMDMAKMSSEAAEREMQLAGLDAIAVALPGTWAEKFAEKAAHWTRRAALGAFLGLAPINPRMVRVGTHIVAAGTQLVDDTARVLGRHAAAAESVVVPAVARTAIEAVVTETVTRYPLTARAISLGSYVIARAFGRLVGTRDVPHRALAEEIVVTAPPLDDPVRAVGPALDALPADAKQAALAATELEPRLARRAVLAETESGRAAALDELATALDGHGMDAARTTAARDALMELNLVHNAARSRAWIREVGIPSVARLDEAGPLREAAREMLTELGARRRELLAAGRAEDAARLSRRMQGLHEWTQVSQLVDEGAQLRDVVAASPYLWERAASGGDEMLRRLWVQFRAPRARLLRVGFEEYTQILSRHFVGNYGEFEVAFRLGPRHVLLKAPDRLVTLPGTDLVAIPRGGGDLLLIDNKALAAAQVDAVSALTRNLPRNIDVDLADFARLAKDPGLPGEFGTAIERLRAARAEIEPLVSGRTRAQLDDAALQAQIDDVLRRHGIRRVVTNAGGQVEDLSSELRSMGLDLEDLN